MSLNEKIGNQVAANLPAAIETLRELIRLPVDWTDKGAAEGGDILCGTSNHEGPRIEYLQERLLEVGSVEGPEDTGIDEFGNLWWKVEGTVDGRTSADNTVIYLDGHVDTVAALRSRWHEILGKGVDAYTGMADRDRIDRDALERELGYLPPEEEWPHLIWGRGSADQLAGVVSQIFATRILRQLRADGALAGITVWSYATVAEEDNDGGGPMFYMDRALASRESSRVPDVVILTEPTGSAEHGALGIYRGQRGRMQIEVEILGRSSHGSMPWQGLNPLEHGAAIIAEAAAAYNRDEGFSTDSFLGPGSRTASDATLRTPSDCAVPESFKIRFDRRLTTGEEPQRALNDVESLRAVKVARAAGLEVHVRAPIFEQPTWRGYVPRNHQIYPGWQTPADHPAILAAGETYREIITPMVDSGQLGSSARREPRVDRWVFSTDGVGIPVSRDAASGVDDNKGWLAQGLLRHPAIFGIGAGVEENTHKLGEYVDSRELAAAIAFLARYPAILRHRLAGEPGRAMP